MDFFFDELKKNNVKHVVHLGDVFDRRKYLNFLTAKFAREKFFERLKSANLESVHMICGNHDQYYKDSHTVNSLKEIVEGKYDFHIYDMAEEIDLDGMGVLLMPWIAASNAEHAYEMIKNAKADIVMGHLELNGFEMFKGTFSDHGDMTSVYSKFDLVFSGHYHHKSSNGNIHYLGAFMEHTWSDYNDPRGFHIIDTDTRNVTFFQNPHSIFKMIVYDDTKEDSYEIAQKELKEYNNCYVKVVCANRTDQHAFDTVIENLVKNGAADITVVEDINVLVDNSEEEIDESQDTPKIITSYIDGLSIPVDNKIMSSFMLDIYKEALSVEHIE